MIIIQCKVCKESVEAKTKNTKYCTQCAYTASLTSTRNKRRAAADKLELEEELEGINAVDDGYADRSAYDYLQG